MYVPLCILKVTGRRHMNLPYTCALHCLVAICIGAWGMQIIQENRFIYQPVNTNYCKCMYWTPRITNIYWLVVQPTPLKNMKVKWNDFSLYMKTKYVPNHQPVQIYLIEENTLPNPTKMARSMLSLHVWHCFQDHPCATHFIAGQLKLNCFF